MENPKTISVKDRPAMDKKIVVTRSRHFRTDNTFILTIAEGSYVTRLETIGQRNLDHDLAHFRTMGYQISGDVKPA